MKTIDQMLILDVDGVITNPQEKRITEPEILDQIVKRLETEEPVALNTGRSIKWVKDRVLNPLIKKAENKKMLQNLLIVGEKGGTWAEFNEQGNLIESKNNDISVPYSLKDKIRTLISNEYSDSMFYDESKLTMISIEMKDGYPLEGYERKQEILLVELQTLLADKNFSNKFKLDPTTIAIDIENKFAGKHFAVKRIIEWIKNKGINPQKYIAFGDSFKSDVPIAKQLHSLKLPVKFVYVGQENIDTAAFSFTISQTQDKFEKGTLEFLKSL